MNTVEYKIAKALKNCSYSKGIVCLEDEEHELGCQTKYYDDYSIIEILGKLFEDEKAKLIFRVGREDKDMDRLLNLLK